MFEEGQTEFYQVVRGFPCPVSRWFTKKKMEDAMDLMPGDGDLILASYPKTGTTWMNYVLLQIKSRAESFPSFQEVTFKIVPYIELTGVEAVHAQSKPRLYKHHIAYDFVQKNDKSKVVYVYRHPEDTVVSFYHFLRGLHPDIPLDFDQFFDGFLSGKIGYGSYFRHVLSFYKHREDENLLMVSYEKLHSHRREEILRIAKFLGEEHYQSLSEDEQLFEKIVERTSFDYMKKNLTSPPGGVPEGSGEKPVEDKHTPLFFRKGVVGDGKTVLTDAQRQLLKEAAEKLMEGTTVLDEWYPK